MTRPDFFGGFEHEKADEQTKPMAFASAWLFFRRAGIGSGGEGDG